MAHNTDRVGWACWSPGGGGPRRRHVGSGGGERSDRSVHATHRSNSASSRTGLKAGVELGALWVLGLGGDRNFTRRGLWAVATVGGGLAWAPQALRGHGALIVAAEAALALYRPQLVFNEDLEVYRLGPAAFRGQFLLEARFP